MIIVNVSGVKLLTNMGEQVIENLNCTKMSYFIFFPLHFCIRKANQRFAMRYFVQFVKTGARTLCCTVMMKRWDGVVKHADKLQQQHHSQGAGCC